MRFAALLATLLPALVAAAAPAPWTTSTGATASWDSNITNSDVSNEAIGALTVSARANAARRTTLLSGSALIVGLDAAVESVPRFDGLDQARAGLDLAWQRKFGLGPLAPSLSLNAGAQVVAAHDSDRTGWEGRAGLSWTQRSDEKTLSTISAKWSHLDARDPVFDRASLEVSVHMTRDLNERWSISLDSFYRDGDVLSYALPPRPDLALIVPLRKSVDTFGDTRTAYSVNGNTWAGGLGLSRVMSPAAVATLAYQYRDTHGGALRYVNHLVTLGLLLQF